MNAKVPEITDTHVGPLSGVIVLEIGAFMAAPFATMQLADLGAEVIKIENPEGGGEPVRTTGPFINGHSSPFARLNRNKQSIGLDLKSASGKQIFRRLIETADILVENLRPGTLTGLGFGYEEARELNPRLIYISVSGWGQDGPLSELPGLDIMAQARSGLMSITGTEQGEVVKIGVPICDLACGLYAAIGALSALRSRETSGVGQHVDVSLFEAGVSFMIWEAGQFFATGEVGKPSGTAHQATAPYQSFRTADGWVTLGATTPKTWQGLCEVLQSTELLSDPRFVDGFTRLEYSHILIPKIEEKIKKWDTFDIVDALNEAGVPCAPISTVDEVFDNDHLKQRDFFWDAPHPKMGLVRQIGSPIRLSEDPPVRRNAGPLLGADSEKILLNLGIESDVREELFSNGTVIGPRETGGLVG